MIKKVRSVCASVCVNTSFHIQLRFKYSFNTLKQGQDGRHFEMDVLEWNCMKFH